MDALNLASLVNLLGFVIGFALYAMLLAMVWRAQANSAAKRKYKIDFLLLMTAVLGLLWNAGELVSISIRDFGKSEFPSILLAVSFSALGFLPAVVVHSALQNSENKKSEWLIFAAYVLSLAASSFHFYDGLSAKTVPSNTGLQILIFGFLGVLIALFVLNFKQTAQRKAIWASALTIFALSALHLASHTETDAGNLLIESFGHQASLPLVLAILYENYRFAFADLFLKRALSLVLLTLTAFALYVLVAAPLLHYHETHDRNDVQAITLILTLWIITALIYPFLHRASVWFVDKILLQRIDYKTLQKQISQEIETQENTVLILDTISDKLGFALTANQANWAEAAKTGESRISNYDSQNGSSIEIIIPTAEPPFYQINLGEFIGGRRLLSDEIEMLENISLQAARRIDALRVSHERYDLKMREQQTAKLAAEAELRALRAQLNPHFLFNALTTIGYLIQAAPDKAVETLLRLTQLLRGVLRSTGEFSTLGEELKLIESYLEIEHARFEERLQVKIDVSPDLHRLKIPSLILQPLVENAVKHGISTSKKGGEVKISARLEGQNLMLEVADTGTGVSKEKLAETRQIGVGLSNIEQRLHAHFGNAARFEIESETGVGTTSKIVFPVTALKDSLPQRTQRENLIK
jgi:two-component sensor histidine kinase